MRLAGGTASARPVGVRRHFVPAHRFWHAWSKLGWRVCGQGLRPRGPCRLPRANIAVWPLRLHITSRSRRTASRQASPAYARPLTSNVMWHWRCMSEASTALDSGARLVLGGGLARTAFAPGVVVILGVAQCRSGGSSVRRAGIVRSRGHGFGSVGGRSAPSRACASVSACSVDTRVAGVRPGPATSGAMPPFSCEHRSVATTASHNKSVQTDRVTAGFACLRASADLQRYRSKT